MPLSTFELIVKAVHERIVMTPPLAYGIFRIAQQEHGPLQRVIWIPTDFRDMGVPMSNRIVDDDGQRYKAIYAEQWDVECHIVGVTFTQAELIREAILNSTRAVLGTASKPTGGTWVTQAFAEAEQMSGTAQKVIQNFTWSVNVLETPEPSVIIESAEMGAGELLEGELTIKLPPPA